MSAKKRKSKVNYLVQDWPDNLTMDEEVFEKYAQQLEWEDFEEEVFGLTGSAQQLVTARRDTIEKLRGSAEYLDNIWLRCRVSKTMGTSASMVGGGLTIAGAVLTGLTAGAAAPVLIAGIATSSVGAATNIGTSVVEKIFNSRQIKEMNAALNRDKDITLKLESQIDDIRRYKDSAHLAVLLNSIKDLLGSDHLIFNVLQGVLLYEMSSTLPLSASLSVQGYKTLESVATVATVALAAASSKTAEFITSSAGSAGVITAATGTASTAAGGAASSNLVGGAAAAVVSSCAAAATVIGSVESSKAAVNGSLSAANGSMSAVNGSLSALSNSGKDATVSLLQATREGVKYNPLDAGVFVESGKVIGQNSIRVAGQVIIGVSAAFLVWDAIDLGFTISDLVRRQGSQAARTLRDKADRLEEAMKETMSTYSLELPS